jgi:predicted Rossmann fold flavoprotein
MLKALSECSFKQEKVLKVEKSSNKFIVKTDKMVQGFDAVVIAVGGHAGFELAKGLGHTIINPKPALCGLLTKQNFKKIQGVSMKQVEATVSRGDKKFSTVTDDILFTHEGISGPLAYKISSICAREDFDREKPLKISLNFVDGVDFDLQNLLNINSKKDIKNLVSEFVPKSIAEFILEKINIKLDEKCCNINGKTRDLILDALQNFTIEVTSPAKEGEVVTSGGVSLDEINPKTMESKLIDGLYFCGEVIDVDGFCGGFNLQNCWSTGFVAGSSI